MDIGSGKEYPANALSNFSPHQFTIDGVKCNSMEGFLQSLKFENPDMQREVCTLVGFAAKKKGRNKNWKESQTLHWQGAQISRKSDAYASLLERAFMEMAKQSASFQNALKAAQNAVFKHSIGKSKESETVLTEREFCKLLNVCREWVNSTFP